MEILGIDIGGSGLKAAVVDTRSGQLIGARHRIPTPQPARPKTGGQGRGKTGETISLAGIGRLRFPGSSPAWYYPDSFQY